MPPGAGELLLRGLCRRACIVRSDDTQCEARDYCHPDDGCVPRTVVDGTDAGTDSGAGADSGLDAGSDTGVDAGSDSGLDSGADVGADAGTDAGSDSGVPPIMGAHLISSGHAASCGIYGGGLFCWGANANGTVGDGTMSRRAVPYRVPEVVDPVTIALGGSLSDGDLDGRSACALSRGGRVWCWGLNEFGQVGDNSLAMRLRPVPVMALRPGILDVAVGSKHACAVAAGGRVYCWGDNSSMQLGYAGANSMVPVEVVGLPRPVLEVDLGHVHSCAFLDDRRLACWGNNFRGEVGDGTRTDRAGPFVVPSVTGVTSSSAGGRTTCAVDGAGRAFCWGRNTDGRLGRGGVSPQETSPDLLVGLGGGRTGHRDRSPAHLRRACERRNLLLGRQRERRDRGPRAWP